MLNLMERKAYIEHYNTNRPHPGIEQRVPKGYTIRNFGSIKSKATLFGLNYEYYREAAWQPYTGPTRGSMSGNNY
jgi:hypothetical protein